MFIYIYIYIHIARLDTHYYNILDCTVVILRYIAIQPDTIIVIVDKLIVVASMVTKSVTKMSVSSVLLLLRVCD